MTKIPTNAPDLTQDSAQRAESELPSFTERATSTKCLTAMTCADKTQVAESGQSGSPSEKGKIYRHGFNNAMEGARAYLELDVEIADFEDHECHDDAFVPCLACDSVRARETQQRELIDRWARQWAMLLVAAKDPIRASLAEMLKLVEDGILVRNTANDEDFQTYITQSNRLVVVLKNAQTARNSA